MSQVRASHILVKYAGSRNPVSRRTNASTASVSKEVALAEIQAILQNITANPAAFDEIAKARSDCSSYKQNGDLGFFGRGEMQKPFEDATYALAVGAISGIVETDSGLHIIKRTG
eukprot:PhF_6_TR17314/c0_g1_i1/m.26532/K09578/PIN1; peptidyl-prolyl cis-trans isomerase NIMA-interacting 1